MGLKDPIVAGINLVRSAIQSVPFVSGLLGWRIARDGSAEFNDVIARGNITARSLFTGDDAPRVKIWNDPGVGPVIEFETEDPDEIAAGLLLMAIESGVGPPFIQMRPPRVLAGPNGMIQFDMTAPPADGSAGGVVLWSGAADSAFHILSNYAVTFDGTFKVPEMRALDVVDGGTRSTTSTSYVFPAGSLAEFTFPYPPSGAVKVTVSTRLQLASTDASDTALLTFEIRDDDASGTVRVAASDNNACAVRGTAGAVPFPASRTRHPDGLPTSGTGYIRCLLKTTDGANQASCIQTILTLDPSL